MGKLSRSLLKSRRGLKFSQNKIKKKSYLTLPLKFLCTGCWFLSLDITVILYLY